MNFKIPVTAATFLILLSSFVLPVINTANADSPVAMITIGTGPVSRVFDHNNGNENVTSSNLNESSGNATSIVASSSPHSAPPSLAQQPPIQTTLTSAMDGNGNILQNESTTFSTSIDFQVRATKGSNPISGFECSFDNKPFSMCANTNPATINLNNLTAGQQHIIAVRAIDNVANTDPNPAMLKQTIITPQQAIQNLVSTIDNMHLSKSASISLETSLIFTIRLLNSHLNTAACATFNAFLNNINANQASGQLTAQQAATLREQVTPIQHTTGCALSPISSSTDGSNNSIAAWAINTKSQVTTTPATPPQQQQSTQQQQPIIADGVNSHNNRSDNRSPSIVSILPF